MSEPARAPADGGAARAADAPPHLRLRPAVAPPHAEVAVVHEIFLSFQGEGVLAGERQVFVRFGGCDIRCPWCDTPESLIARGPGRIERTPGAGDFTPFGNPVAPAFVVAEVARLAREHGPVRWVSITGGEPTIWAAFLARLLPDLKSLELKIFLETNSHHPEVLAPIRPHVDFVSADIKVPFSEYRIGRETYAEFLRLSLRTGPADLQVKVVVTGACPADDVVDAACLVAAVDRRIPFILQPVTPQGAVRDVPSPGRLIELQGRCLAHLDDVRIIPQLHKLVGAL